MPNYRFKKQQTGAISILYIVALFSIITIITVSLNTVYFTLQNTRLQQAIESSIVSIGLAGNKLSLSDYQQIVNSQLAIFFPEKYQDITFTLVPPLTSGGAYTIDADLKSQFFLESWLIFTGLKSDSQLKINSKIGIDVVQRNLEVSLVMDNSGSMYADIDALKNSATLFINQLMNNRAHEEQIYISIIPFADSVNIGVDNLNWISNSLPATAKKHGACVNYRYDTVPAHAVIKHALLPPLNTDNSAASNKFPGQSGGMFSACSDTPILGLSNNKTELINKVNSMIASGSTDGDQGILWGWRSLAEPWQGLWKTAPDRPLSKTVVKKVVLFFSDGAAISNERNIFLPVCNEMKKDDIEIYTIQFSASNNSMIECASDRDHYFYANNQQQLTQAFKDISESVGFELKLKKL